MKTVMRGNKQLSVADERLEEFEKLGYVEVDPETGIPVSVPDVEDKAESALKKKNAELKKANEKLAKENEELTAKFKEAEAYAEVADKTIEELTAKVAELEAAAPSAKT